MFSGIGLDIGGYSWAAVIIAVIVALGVAYWVYRRTNPPLPRGLRVLLFVLRAAAIALLLFILLEPLLSIIWRRVERPVVALLVDTSASMSISESNQDRLVRCRAFLEGPILKEIAAENRIELYQFAQELSPWEGDSLKAGGLATDIAGALETVRRELDDQNLSGVVVLTDGANNLGHNPAHLARAYGLPIFPVGAGSADPGQDISVKEVQVNQVVYVDSRVPVEVTLQSRGLEGLRVPVTLRDGQDVLDSQQITLEGEGREQRVALEFVPQKEGLQRLSLSIPLQEGELVAENNRRDLSLRVLKNKMRALLVWGPPTWDFSFLRRSLERDPNVELTPLALGGRGTHFLGAFPQNESLLFTYDVVILGDLAPRHLSAQQQEWLIRLVTEGGKGLLFLGGPRFGLVPGSPLADLIPLTVAGGRIRAMEDRFWTELTPAGRVHPVMALAEDVLDPERVWQDLPPFLGLNKFGPPKPGATVLAVHPVFEVGKQKLPVIAVQQAGAGKTMVAAIYPIWRWDFMLQGLGKSSQIYDRFWSNAIRWLSTREQGKLIRVYPQSNVFRGGQRIAFRAQLYDESYRPMDRAQVKVMVMRKQMPGQIEVEGNLFESGRRDGRYRGELDVLAPGEYLYRAEIFLGGQKVGRDGGEFVVEEYSLEFEKVELNEELLRAMALASGGAYFHLDSAGELPGRLHFESRETSHRREIELWNHPVILIALVLLLAAEWTVRKRNRLM